MLIVTTALLRALTRFWFMVRIDAGRFIAWIYIPPTVLLNPFIIMESQRTGFKY